MRVHVLYFGMMKDLAGRSSETIDLPEGARMSALLQHWRTSVSRFAEYENSLALARNQEYASADATLSDGDEIAVLPPVSGGSQEETQARKTFTARIVREPIESRSVIDDIGHRDVGSVVVFEGVVRDNTRGRRTLYLDYEGYEPMALRQLELLLVEAKTNFAIRDAAIVHRLGRLEVGETSVLIAVASAHRADGFDACRWIIDMLKKTVPVWKKEYFEDGAVWADGEPFPAEVRNPKLATPEHRGERR
jgi:molybdopterin converting factor subunit 1